MFYLASKQVLDDYRQHSLKPLNLLILFDERNLKPYCISLQKDLSFYTFPFKLEKKFLTFSINPFGSLRSKNGTSSPIIRFATFLYALSFIESSSFTIGSPLFVEVMIPVSSGITPINSQDSISTTSSTLIMSFVSIKFGRTLFKRSL